MRCDLLSAQKDESTAGTDMTCQILLINFWMSVPFCVLAVQVFTLSWFGTAGKIANSATTATDASSASTIVLRNASGDTKVNNLSANTVLANSVKSVTSGNLDIQSNGNVNIDIDNDNNETSKTFNRKDHDTFVGRVREFDWRGLTREPFTMIIHGTPRSGKSYLLQWWLRQYAREYDIVAVFSISLDSVGAYAEVGIDDYHSYNGFC
ncbi:hypothetical protein PAPYR_12654 [Paratrimastix pyriformis]|uniref:Uncharacterized protein n=1 Tax=Paratrimastix pyriformis TaxID=342808 RepID=A0ABQ8U6Q0_9EUKA|nr:hypothetical protein PAPYR_12654 [Paratrimastix pyriformis]